MNKRQRFLEGDKRAKKLFKIYYPNNRLSEQDKNVRFGMLRKTRKFCSNPDCCGNPRRLKGRNCKTIQEKLIEQELNYYKERRSEYETYKV